MSLQDLLASMLRDVFEAERVSADEFLIKLPGGGAIRLVASERDLIDYATANAMDGLAALGDVGDDQSGVTAALGLLAVDIEENVVAGGDEPVTLLTVRNGELSVVRAASFRID